MDQHGRGLVSIVPQILFLSAHPPPLKRVHESSPHHTGWLVFNLTSSPHRTLPQRPCQNHDIWLANVFWEGAR